MLIQRNDNKKKANGNLYPILTLGEVCLALHACPHYIWCLGHVVRKGGSTCLESLTKLLLNSDGVLAKQTSWVQKQRGVLGFYHHSNGRCPWLEICLL